MIRLRVPGSLKYRDLAVRAVAAACKLVGAADGAPPVPVDRELVDQVVSAFGEAFNNAALHSYRGRPPGDVEIELEVGAASLTIRMLDYGNSFAFDDVPTPDLDALPESGLGIFIIKSFMDEVSYVAGAPNVLRMVKRIGRDER
ncbi:MAG TPA: ATP-binding protein [Polyangia bacterium]|jgi:serine/threonine-protein kinase RsbW